MVMAKDREGKFHPRKGKPSGSMRTEGSGPKPVSSSAFEENLEIAEKYTVGEEEPAPHVNLRHRNRNVDKREERQQDRSAMQNTKTKRETFNVAFSDTVPGQPLDVLPKELFARLANHKAPCCIS